MTRNIATTVRPSARFRASTRTGSSTPGRPARPWRPRSESAGWWSRHRYWRPSHEKVLADRGTARIEQHAFADFLTRGELDRHLRRMRARYRGRRDALIDALADALPEAAISGVAAGLHVTVKLPDGDDEGAIREEALLRSIELETMSEYRPHAC